MSFGMETANDTLNSNRNNPLQSGSMDSSGYDVCGPGNQYISENQACHGPNTGTSDRGPCSVLDEHSSTREKRGKV